MRFLALLDESDATRIAVRHTARSHRDPQRYGVLAPVAVSATVNTAPWHESVAALVIEIAFVRSTGRLPLAGTSQPLPPFVCGDVTETLPVLQLLCPASTETAPSAIELT